MPNLSFRIRETTWRKGVIIAFSVALGVLVPVLYGVWYFHFGGAEMEQRRSLQKLAASNPDDDGRKAIQKEKFQLYAILNDSSIRVPGVVPLEEYRSAFGYRCIRLLAEKGITPEQRAINQSVLQYLRIYNQKIYDYVNREYPDWREKAKVRGGIKLLEEKGGIFTSVVEINI